jgi:hypothetical protein
MKMTLYRFMRDLPLLDSAEMIYSQQHFDQSFDNQNSTKHHHFL